MGAEILMRNRFQYVRHLPPWEGTVPMDTDVLVTHAPPVSFLSEPAEHGHAFMHADEDLFVDRNIT